MLSLLFVFEMVLFLPERYSACPSSPHLSDPSASRSSSAGVRGRVVAAVKAELHASSSSYGSASGLVPANTVYSELVYLGEPITLL